MRTDITPGQTSDYLGFDLVMSDNLPKPQVLLADRGYDADRIQKTREQRGFLMQIPMHRTRKMRVGVDHTLHRLCNLVGPVTELFRSYDDCPAGRCFSLILNCAKSSNIQPFFSVS